MSNRFVFPVCIFIMLAAGVCLTIIFGCGDDDGGNPAGPSLPSGLERITSAGGTNPTLSPDGNWLAFRVSGTGIIKRSLSSGQQDILTSSGLEPHWAPVGNLILYRSGGLYAVNADTKETAFIRSNAGWDDGAVWSPNMDEIAAEGSQGLVVISYPDTILSAVECYDPDGTGCQGESPTWSPDGQWIAFEDGLEILKVKRSGDTAVAVVEGLNDVGSPSWSPNGQWIAFVMQDSGSADMHIWVADQRGTDFGLWRVTESDSTCCDTLPFGCYDTEPCWSPDSKAIYFQSNRTGQYEIWRIGFPP